MRDDGQGRCGFSPQGSAEGAVPGRAPAKTRTHPRHPARPDRAAGGPPDDAQRRRVPTGPDSGALRYRHGYDVRPVRRPTTPPPARPRPAPRLLHPRLPPEGLPRPGRPSLRHHRSPTPPRGSPGTHRGPGHTVRPTRQLKHRPRLRHNRMRWPVQESSPTYLPDPPAQHPPPQPLTGWWSRPVETRPRSLARFIRFGRRPRRDT
jgi:hypothetical protein